MNRSPSFASALTLFCGATLVACTTPPQDNSGSTAGTSDAPSATGGNSNVTSGGGASGSSTTPSGGSSNGGAGPTSGGSGGTPVGGATNGGAGPTENGGSAGSMDPGSGGGVGGTGTGNGNGNGGSAEGGSGNSGAGGENAGSGPGGAPSIPMGHAECADPPAMVITEVVTDLNQPTYVTFEPRDNTRYYVTERGGTIQRFDGQDMVQILDIPVATGGYGEQGLHSLAFHPNWGVDGETRVYIGHTKATGNNAQLWQYDLVGDEMVNGELIDEFTKNDGNHNGGLALFGPDGLLYFSLGDGGGANDPNGYGQDLMDPRASILRYNVDDWDSPPMGNRSGAGEDTRVLHWGLRNAWRYSFDLGTGDMYIGDVGQNDVEEVDIAPAGSGGLNFGWSVREGSIECPGCNAGGPSQPEFTSPVDEYGRADGKSVTGGYVYRGSRIPGMVGRYIYADYDSNKVWIFTYDGTQICNKVEVSADIDPEGAFNGISSFGQDHLGEIYLVSYDTGPGKVFRLDPAP